ncbi:DNA primase [termite gut metagenome]|uniref:DNA primase n=1 Tax=termite gut metagenome TaxID=433724 RepID=A0A5J4PMY9_9ZZZZ
MPMSRAVIGMDGKLSEVGESNGRSGKSLIGELMRRVVQIAYVPGKNRDLFNDQFIWNDVVENTKLVFIDDVLRSFNFEQLFPNITDDWSVNYKDGRRVTFPFIKSLKLYIATNHAVSETGSSFTDRQWLLAFSDFYNDEHKPVDDFGALFFDEWDFGQWNLT